MNDNKRSDVLLQQWMQDFGSDILHTCFLYLGDKALAEDAAQDTFIKAWRSIDRFERRDGASPKTWITRIAINTCKDYRRSMWFRHVDLSQNLDTLPLSSLSSEEEALALMIDITRLPHRCRQAILLCHVQNMRMEEAAQTLGVSRSCLYRRLQKAYDLLGRPAAKKPRNSKQAAPSPASEHL